MTDNKRIVVPDTGDYIWAIHNLKIPAGLFIGKYNSQVALKDNYFNPTGSTKYLCFKYPAFAELWELLVSEECRKLPIEQVVIQVLKENQIKLFHGNLSYEIAYQTRKVLEDYINNSFTKVTPALVYTIILDEIISELNRHNTLNSKL